MPAANKVAVIGAGSVGAAISYALLLRHNCAELLLVDVDQQRVAGEVADLSDGTFLSNTRVMAGTPQQAGQCDIIVITAGAKQRDGETRIQLIERNFQILQSVINGMKPLNPNAIIIVVANPCDILAYFAQKMSGLPYNQVFSSGTFLDTSRLRERISEKLRVAKTAVHAYVLGEHGDTQFVAWSSARVGPAYLTDFPEFRDQAYLDRLAASTKNAAYDIIKAKGATYFGIASVVSSLVECIFMNQRHIRPLSTYSPELKCYTSMPVVLGSGGIDRTIPIELNDAEKAKLEASCASLREIIAKYEPRLA